MALTRDFKETVMARVEREPEFARAMLDEAVMLFLNGEAPVGQVKFLHLWPGKILQAGQVDYQSSVLSRARRAAASLSL